MLHVICAREQYTTQQHPKKQNCSISQACIDAAVGKGALMANVMLQRRCLDRSIKPRIRCEATSVARCPFAKFAISPPAGKAKPKPSPLDQTDTPNMVGANFWLAAGKPGQDVPGKLVSGIHRLYEVRACQENVHLLN